MRCSCGAVLFFCTFLNLSTANARLRGRGGNPIRIAARKVLSNPSNSRAHLRLAAAYFARGGEGDAARFWRHANRAIELDAFAKSKVRRIMSRPAFAAKLSGLGSIPDRSEEQGKVDGAFDGKLEATLSEGGSLRTTKWDGNSRRALFALALGRTRDYDQRHRAIAGAYGIGGVRETWGAWTNRKNDLRTGVWRIGSLLTDYSTRIVGGLRTLPHTMGFRAGGAYLSKARTDALDAFSAGKIETSAEHLVDTVAIAATVLSTRLRSKEKNPIARMGTNFAATIGQLGLKGLTALKDPAVPASEVAGVLTEMACVGKTGSPLLIDLNDSGAPDLRDTLIANGVFCSQGSVRFDLDGDGKAERVEWYLPGCDGLLVVDGDGDGRITSGHELFGTAGGDADGFACLARLDRDGDGWIAGQEAKDLRIWLDDGDGVSTAREIFPLARFGIRAISTLAKDNCSVVRTTGKPLRCWDWWPDLRP